MRNILIFLLLLLLLLLLLPKMHVSSD